MRNNPSTQTDEQVAAIIAAKFLAANIPLIAIDIPHPGATFYGANNYEAGLIGGRHLGRWAKENWHSEVDEIVLLELARAGSVPRMRLTGMLVGLNLVLPKAKSCRVTYLEGDGELHPSWKVVGGHLRSSPCRRTLVLRREELSYVRWGAVSSLPWLSSPNTTGMILSGSASTC